MGYPSFHNEHWDPMWQAMADTGTIMNVHIGSSGRLAITAPERDPFVLRYYHALRRGPSRVTA
jgi:hypothetical protein